MQTKEKLYVTAEDLGELMGISVGHAYKIIRQLNNELEKKGFIVVSGKVSRRYFEKRCYGVEEVS